MRFRAVVFDLFITLTDWDAERLRPRFQRELAAAADVDAGEFSSLVRATFTERATGQMGDGRATVVALASRLGRQLDAKLLDRLCALRLEQARQTLTPRAGVMEAIAEIRGAGYAIGVLTDCTDETVQLWPSLPYAAVVDAVTFSCQVGRRKPDPIGYADIVGKLGVTPAECVYVGDGGSSELTGARRAGMTAVLLETPFDAADRYDAEAHWTGPSVAELSELLALLRDS